MRFWFPAVVSSSPVCTILPPRRLRLTPMLQQERFYSREKNTSIHTIHSLSVAFLLASLLSLLTVLALLFSIANIYIIAHTPLLKLTLKEPLRALSLRRESAREGCFPFQSPRLLGNPEVHRLRGKPKPLPTRRFRSGAEPRTLYQHGASPSAAYRAPYAGWGTAAKAHEVDYDKHFTELCAV